MLPLEWSMTLWFTAVPQWEPEPEPPLDDIDEFGADLGADGAVAAAAVDSFAALLAAPMPLWLPAQDDAALSSPATQAAPVPAPAATPMSVAMPATAQSAPVATRLVFKGYQWIPATQWQQIAGRLWHAWVDNMRHDALRHKLARPHVGRHDESVATADARASGQRA